MSTTNVTVQFGNVQTGKNTDVQVPTNGTTETVSSLLKAAGSTLEYVTEVQLLAGRENVTLVVMLDGQTIATINGNTDNVANLNKSPVGQLSVQATKTA